MLINNIELKNFRNHKEALFEFEKGINLILGENGSGKTSILDAIGFALFNMTLRSNANETLTMNESSGYVKISFTGNDSNRYSVIRKFPGGTVSLSEDSVKKNITGVTEVYKKINSLIGNVTGNPALFENVIVASQNKFTSIFDAKPSDREDVFNSVFGTEIYRQMYKGILKDTCDAYEKRLTFAGGELESQQQLLKDSTELKNNSAAAEKEFAAAEKIYKKSEKNIETAEKKVQEFELLKNRKEKLQITIKGINAQIDDKNKLIESIRTDLKTAEAAVLEEMKLKPEHEEYEKIKTLQDKLGVDINNLELSEAEFNRYKDEAAKCEKNKAEAEGEAKRLNQQIESDNRSVEGLLQEIEKLSESTATIEKNKTEIDNELLSLVKRKSAFDDLYKKIKKTEEESSNRKLLAEKAECSSEDEVTLGREIAKFEEEHTKLEKLKTERDRLKSEITRYSTLLKELENAERNLSKQSCPYLKEQCKNIEHAGSVSGYFDPKKKEISLLMTGLTVDFRAFDDLDERINRCADNKSVRNEQLNRLKKNINEALIYRKQESEFKQKTAEYALSIAKLFAGINSKESQAVSADNYESASAEMHGAEASLRTKLDGIAALLKEKRNECKKKENDLNEIRNRIDAASRKMSFISEQIKNYEVNLKKLFESGRILKEKIMPLPALKKEAAEYNDILKKLEPVDQQYRRAVQRAAEKNKLMERLAAEKVILENLAKQNKTANSEHDAITYNAEDHQKHAALCIGLKAELKEHTLRMINLKSAFDMALKAEEINSRLALEIKEKCDQIDALKRKKEIADLFRENVKMLGPYIAERRTKMIAAAATENFQRMTGRAERILWENNSEQYLVSVASGTGRRRYNMLSGGEQVAVALSIRSALASEMTDCRFAIFDEPTINLDAEKRDALSVSLYDMLKNLEQALVVTHDSTFREMATKVIELDRLK